MHPIRFLHFLFAILLAAALVSCDEVASKEGSAYLNPSAPSADGGQAGRSSFATGVPTSVVGLLGGVNISNNASNITNGTLTLGGTGALTITSGGTSSTANQGGNNSILTAEVAPATQAQAIARTMIYQAGLVLVVANVAQTMEEIKQQAIAMGGYLQESNGDMILVRVPATSFNDAITNIERMGEVSDRHIKAQDVTEEMRDLKIRLENAEAVRERLTAFLDKSTKMEETLQIEKELERVTEEIELMKGKIQYMQSQVAFSSIQVTLNSPLPQKQMVAQIPFDWVRDLGDGLVNGQAEPTPDASHWLPRNARFELPKDYIRYYERDYVTEAMSAHGMIIKLKRQDNYDGGDVPFWSNLVHRAMVENRAIPVDVETDIKLNSGPAGKELIGYKDIGGNPCGYLVGVVVNKRHVYTFEAWGPKDTFLKDRPDLEHALLTLNANW